MYNASERRFLAPAVLRKAGDRSRTGDLQLGKLTLYQLSYARVPPIRRILRMGREGLEPPTSAM